MTAPLPSRVNDWEYQLFVLAEVALAGILGGIIGLERELRRKAAGIRTQMLIAGAAALLVNLGAVMARQWDDANLGHVQTDPVRIMEAIITGISFIGAGTIIFRRSGHLEGITTAASILFTAGVGITVALDQWVLAISLTVFALVILWGVGKCEAWLMRRQPPKEKRGDGPAGGQEGGPAGEAGKPGGGQN